MEKEDEINFDTDLEDDEKGISTVLFCFKKGDVITLKIELMSVYFHVYHLIKSS
jgi:hypothetical protein